MAIVARILQSIFTLLAFGVLCFGLVWAFIKEPEDPISAETIMLFGVGTMVMAASFASTAAGATRAAAARPPAPRPPAGPQGPVPGQYVPGPPMQGR
ncbi:hypothetical protein [Virgisporangium aliadipatigenens]|uniref:hypothetical protein n=1 Tax=Virgisporangium aliadipatigenens TaxID=741659 RepID=UPI001944F3AF|nr:hypothetical protein [Virgisporangium aliadipatigenens]